MRLTAAIPSKQRDHVMRRTEYLIEMIFNTDLLFCAYALKDNDEFIGLIGNAGFAIGGDLQMLPQQGRQLALVCR